MQFTRREDLVSVVRVTGPSHNLLALQAALKSADGQEAA